MLFNHHAESQHLSRNDPGRALLFFPDDRDVDTVAGDEYLLTRQEGVGRGVIPLLVHRCTPSFKMVGTSCVVPVLPVWCDSLMS